MVPSPYGGIPSGAHVAHPMPPQVRISRKRIYKAAGTQDQVLLEERLAKRARTTNQAKRRPFL